MEDEKSLRIAYLSKYLRIARQDCEGQSYTFLELLESDMIAFLEKKAIDGIDNEERLEALLKYTEELYLQGAITREGVVEMFLRDTQDALKLASNIMADLSDKTIENPSKL